MYNTQTEEFAYLNTHCFTNAKRPEKL